MYILASIIKSDRPEIAFNATLVFCNVKIRLQEEKREKRKKANTKHKTNHFATKI
jgi:hypothetical protein